jgi:hypothetical protein
VLLAHSDPRQTLPKSKGWMRMARSLQFVTYCSAVILSGILTDERTSLRRVGSHAVSEPQEYARLHFDGSA